MIRLRWVAAFLFFWNLSLSAQTTSPVGLSRTDAHAHLFGRSMDVEQVPDGVTAWNLQSTSSDRKSVGLAAVYSLLLPGMGELYAGGFGSGKYFLAAEGALWLTYAGFETYGNSLRDDARAFAIARAGIDPSGKKDQFYIDIGNFIDIYGFNEKKLRDREADKLYDPQAGYFWQWDSDASRAEYRDQRISAEKMFNNRKFVVAAVIINHVASAINAARSAISHNNALDDEAGALDIGARVLGSASHPHGVMITVTRNF